MPEVLTPKNGKRLHWLLVGVITLATLVALATFASGWLMEERKESIIVAGGPFDTHFGQGLYPDRQLELEVWLETTIPKGTTRTEANRILAPSFASEITGGNEVTIESTSTSAGGSHTKVTLIFDAGGKFQDAKVTQHWAYL